MAARWGMTKPPARRSLLMRILGADFLATKIAALSQGFTLVFAILFLLKLWVGDKWYWSKFIFYIPSPFLLIAAIATIWWPGAFGWRGKAVFTALFLVLAGMGLWVEQPTLFRSPPEQSGAGDLRVVTWNVMAYTTGEVRIGERILALDPDIVVIVEGTFRERRPERLAKTLGAQYHWAVGDRLSIASRLPIKDSRVLVKMRGARVFVATIETPIGPMDVAAIDMLTPRGRDDGRAYLDLEKALAQLGDNAIAAGDMNTPRGSRYINRVFKGWRDDMLEVGGGRWQASWPSPLPLWYIDQSFSRGEVIPVGAHLPWGLHSDHLPVVVDYVFSAPPE